MKKLNIDIPKTTPEYPYVEFRINENGEIFLNTTDSWWGGVGGGFMSSDGTYGNTCLPEELNGCIVDTVTGKIKKIEKHISELQKQVKKLKSIIE